MPLTNYIDGDGVRLQATPSPDPLGQPLGLTGAVAATRYVGGNASGAPLTGTFAVGDFVVNADASIFVCTVAGTPGTWVDTATVGPSVSSVFGRTGAVVAGNADYLAVATGGLTGAVTATRYVGGTASLAPTTGTFAVGDHVVTATGRIWVCTVAGTPGTWVEPASVTFAPLASPTFTGTPAAPTAAADTNTTQIATTAYVVGNAYAKLAGPTFTGTVTVPAAAAVTSAPRLNQLSPALTITSGALPTTTLSSGTGAQISTSRDAEAVTPITGDATNNAATVAVALSPDNVTYSALFTWSLAAAVNLVGAITDNITVRVPAAWYLKLTASHATIGSTTYY